MNRLFAILMLIGMSLSILAADVQYELRVDGLACPYCAYGIEKKIKALDGVVKDSVEIKLNEGLVVFRTNDQPQLTEASLKTLINDAGFTLRNFTTQFLNQEN